MTIQEEVDILTRLRKLFDFQAPPWVFLTADEMIAIGVIIFGPSVPVPAIPGDRQLR